MSDMTRERYRYVQRQVTRHGKVAWYFRMGDGPRERMKGEYGSPEFVEQWRSLIAGEDAKHVPVASKYTLQWLVTKYEASAEFKALAPSTQRMRSNVLKGVCATGGKLLIAQVTRTTIAAGRDRRAGTPFAAINFMKIMGYLFEWAVDAGHAAFNPVKDVKRLKVKSAGFTPWVFDDVAKFYKAYPLGTNERLAMDLLLFTGLRRSDVYRLGPQHIRNEVIEFRTQKTAEPLYIPVHPALRRSIDACDCSHLAFLVTPKQKRPFKSEASFGNWFGEICDKAEIETRAHGLRKLLAQIVAESGGSNAELKALFGWTTDAMAALYTKNANRRKLAKAGAERLNENILSPHPNSETPHLEKGAVISIDYKEKK